MAPENCTDAQRLEFFVIWHGHVTRSTWNKQDGGQRCPAVVPAVPFDRFVNDYRHFVRPSGRVFK